MSFMKRAQEAAEAARSKVEEAAASASKTAADPTTTERINKSLSGAGQGARGPGSAQVALALGPLLDQQAGREQLLDDAGHR